MKKLKRFWGNIPRKYRAAINSLAVLCLVFLIYILIGSPAFTRTQKFRRMEQAELVGPARILASVDLDTEGYDGLILAETPRGVILFQSNAYPWDPGRLTYREKDGAVTVMTTPYIRHGLYDAQVIDLPVFVFHAYPGAVRAELELEFGQGLAYYTEVNWTYGDASGTTTYDKTWHLESREELGGVFRFDLHAEPEGETISDAYYDHWQPLTSEGQALEVFSRLMEPGDSYIFAAIPATVRLYDEADDLIAEEHLTIRSPAGYRYASEQ